MKTPRKVPTESLASTTVCPDGDTADFLAHFRAKVRQHHIPLSGVFSLTYRCNFDCVHCYLGRATRRRKKKPAELPFPAVAHLLDKAADAGCLTMLLTGGEPLIRPDFPDIYRHAARKGLLLTLFTNGTLLNSRVIKVLRTYPPRAVEITLYGANENTYARVTRRKGMFQKTMDGIRRLREADVRFRLKAMLMKDTEPDLECMERLAAELGVPFRFDAALSPTLDGNLAPLAHRVPPQRVVAREIASAAQAALWRRTLDTLPKLAGADPRLYTCGAGRTSFHLDPEGRLSPCLMISWLTRDVTTSSFSQAWEDLGKALDSMRAPPRFPCRACPYKNLCGYCPAFFRLETGSERTRSAYLCELGRSRLDKRHELAES